MKLLVLVVSIVLLVTACTHEQSEWDQVNRRLNQVESQVRGLERDVGDAFGGFKTALIVLTLFVIFFFSLVFAWIFRAHRRLELMQQAMIQLYIDAGRAPPITQTEILRLPRSN